ncbi:MAG: magnetochrome domain-containing protein, partial [Gammaproteobacteria bacterium]|nr:magnetochrome domain-containing protein [Gammaproteobacteria bacterium]
MTYSHFPFQFTVRLTLLWLLSLIQPLTAAPVSTMGGHVGSAEVINLASASSGNFIGADIKLYEAHWQGMDVMKLTAELRKQLGYPMGMQGVIINEVTLNAALSGMLGGDIIVAVKDMPVVDLETFQFATRQVKDLRHAAVTVMRKGERKDLNGRYMMRQMVYMIRARLELGFAQVEGAPMILPGDPRPHAYRGPCTDCHTVGSGTFTMPDPDLIILPPPNLTSAEIAAGKRPHRDRGAC